MIAALVPGLVSLVGKFIDKAVPDKDMAEQLKSKFAGQVHELAKSELQGRINIILAEANGGWLQRNWRPGMMVLFAGIIVARWFGFTAENITPELEMQLFDIIKIGLGGYVVSRGAEKVSKMYMEAKRGE